MHPTCRFVRSLLFLIIGFGFFAIRASAYEAIITDDSSGRNNRASSRASALKVTRASSASLRYDLYAEGVERADIRRATLKLNVVRVSKPGTIIISTASSSWEEGDGTLPQPAIPIGTAELNSSHAQQILPIDVTEIVRTWIAKGEIDPSFVLSSNDALDVALYSKESGRAAVLEIEIAEGAAGPISFDLIQNKPTTLAGYGITDAASKGSNSDITSLTGLTTPLSQAQGGTGATDTLGAREHLGIVEPWRGLPNLTKAAYGEYGGGSSFSVLLMGDSMTGGYVIPMTRAWQSAFGVSGLTVGAVNALVGNGATFVGGGGAENSKYWPTGVYNRLPTAGTVTFSENVNGAIVSNSLRVYYVKEPGAGTFRIQTELDLSGVWNDEPSAGIIDADNSRIEGGVAVVPLKSVARAYRMRVVGVSGVTKIIGATMQNTNSRGALVGWIYANSGQGGDLTDGSNMLMGATLQSILSPILADIAPRTVVVHWRDGITDKPAGPGYTSWRQLRERWGQAYPNTDWILVGTAPYGVIGAVDQAVINYAWREYADEHSQSDAYVDGYTCFGSGATAMQNGLLNPDGVHLSEQGSALLINRIFDQLGISQMSPQWLQNGFGERLYSSNNFQPGVTSREVGQRAGFSIQGHRNSVKQLEFLNESEQQVGSLAFLPENAENGEGNEFVLSLSGVPSLKGTLYGGFSVGFNAPPPGAQWDIHNRNPSMIALRVNGPNEQEADLTQWKRGGTTVARLTNSGGIEGQSLKIGGSGAKISTVFSTQVTLDPAAIPAGTASVWSIKVSGASTVNTPTVSLGWSAPLESDLRIEQAWISGPDTVSIRVSNASSRDIKPAAVTCRATVMQFSDL